MDNLKIQTDILKYKVSQFNLTSIGWWIPSGHEIFIFLISIILLFILVMLFHYNSIQNRVKKESRCLRENKEKTASGVYTVTATNSRNKPLYRVGYNLGAKQYSLECACNPGDVVNTFKNIHVYDMHTNSVQTVTEKQCQCDSYLMDDASGQVYYTGYPGLVQFMNSTTQLSSSDLQKEANVSFFKPNS